MMSLARMRSCQAHGQHDAVRSALVHTECPSQRRQAERRALICHLRPQADSQGVCSFVATFRPIALCHCDKQSVPQSFQCEMQGTEITIAFDYPMERARACGCTLSDCKGELMPYASH